MLWMSDCSTWCMMVSFIILKEIHIYDVKFRFICKHNESLLVYTVTFPHMTNSTFQACEIAINWDCSK